MTPGHAHAQNEVHVSARDVAVVEEEELDLPEAVSFIRNVRGRPGLAVRTGDDDGGARGALDLNDLLGA